MANYLCKNVFSMPYPLATVHPLQTDGRTDDNHDNSLTVTWVRSTKNYAR